MGGGGEHGEHFTNRILLNLGNAAVTRTFGHVSRPGTDPAVFRAAMDVEAAAQAELLR